MRRSANPASGAAPQRVSRPRGVAGSCRAGHRSARSAPHLRNGLDADRPRHPRRRLGARGRDLEPPRQARRDRRSAARRRRRRGRDRRRLALGRSAAGPDRRRLGDAGVAARRARRPADADAARCGCGPCRRRRRRRQGLGGGAKRQLGALFARATAAEQDFLRPPARRRAAPGRARRRDGRGGRRARRACRRPRCAARRCSPGDLGDGGRMAALATARARAAASRALAVDPAPARPADARADRRGHRREALAGSATAALEWKLDGARVQVHKEGDEVRVYTRALNDVTGVVPGGRRRSPRAAGAPS